MKFKNNNNVKNVKSSEKLRFTKWGGKAQTRALIFYMQHDQVRRTSRVSLASGTKIFKAIKKYK